MILGLRDWKEMFTVMLPAGLIRYASLAAALLSAPHLCPQDGILGPGYGTDLAPALSFAGAAGVLRLEASPGREGVLVFGQAVPVSACHLSVSPDVVVPFRTDDRGVFAATLPAGATTRGLVAQAIVAATATGRFAVSNALHLGGGALRERLPVFRLASPGPASRAKMDAVLASTLGTAAVDAIDRPGPDTLGRKAQAKEIETYVASGGLYLRDADKRWNPSFVPALPTEAESRAIADRFLAQHQLLPGGSARTQVDFAGFAETGFSEDRPGPVAKTLLDRQVNYEVRVAVELAGRVVPIPVVGGGGQFKVAVGDAGDIVGYHGVWRPITGLESLEEISSKAEAEASYRARAKDLDLVSVDASLAYYSAPAFEHQTLLAPVWVIKAVANVNGVLMPVRNTIVAATKYGPTFTEGPPRIRVDDLPAPLSAYQGGTSWLGSSYGLPGSEANASGFDTLISALSSWSMRFNWGNGNALESDWGSNDDSWVDACDFVFYTGHASQYGWSLANGTLTNSEVGSSPENPGDHYGQYNLEWLIIAACGPHQSTHFRSSGTSNVFDRWRGTFDGLHTFMGYGGVTYDNTSEGWRVVLNAALGYNVIDAWFRAAEEVQPATNGYSNPDGPTIYVTAIYAHDGSGSMRYDRIWGTGTTYGDARTPDQTRVFIWSGT